MSSKTTTTKVIVCYVPVIHQGYLKLFKKYATADIYIIDPELLKPEFRSIIKDLRALSGQQIVKTLQALLPDCRIKLLKSKTDLKNLAKKKLQLILPEDEISDWLVETYFKNQPIMRDDIFLRWSKNHLRQRNDVAPDEIISVDQLNQKLMKLVVDTSQKSLDWWRQVGAMVVIDGQVITTAINQHQPLDQAPYINGDPRANAHSGELIELATSLHAEEAVIALAAKKGIALEGADLYATTFPCPYCARLIAFSGIKRLFYTKGYSVLDGQNLLKSQGVKIIKVNL